MQYKGAMPSGKMTLCKITSAYQVTWKPCLRDVWTKLDTQYKILKITGYILIKQIILLCFLEFCYTERCYFEFHYYSVIIVVSQFWESL